jgi:hypothetical protein
MTTAEGGGLATSVTPIAVQTARSPIGEGVLPCPLFAHTFVFRVLVTC